MLKNSHLTTFYICLGLVAIAAIGLWLTNDSSIDLNFSFARANFDYSLTSSKSVIVAPGDNALSPINLTFVNGVAQMVTVSVSRLPAGVTAHFDSLIGASKGSCMPTCTSSLYLTVNSSTQPGTYTINVTGKSRGLRDKKSSFVLTVSSINTPPPPTPPPTGTPPPVTSSTCTANSQTTFSSCVNLLNSGQKNTIDVTAQISCTAAAPCRFPQIKVAKSASTPARIRGTVSGAGFYRSGDYSYELLTVTNSTGLVIDSLKVANDSNAECGSACKYILLSIGESSDITVNNVNISNSKFLGIAVSNSNRVIVQNSTISNNGWFGIWTRSANNMSILANTFEDNLSNAILGTFTGTSTSPSVIKGNMFINNHRQAIFNVCGSDGSGPCAGGQLDIESPTKYLTISNNEIKNGSLSIGTLGIELNTNSDSITIDSNKIHDNTGAGIWINAGAIKMTNLRITNNTLYNNGWGGNIPQQVWDFSVNPVISGNCFSADGC